MKLGIGIGIGTRHRGGAIGSDVVTNGGFATDTVWTKGGGWTIAAGVASRTATGSQSDLEQSVLLIVGATYRVTYTLTRSAGGITPRLEGGTNVPGTLRTTSATFTDDLVAVAGNNVLSFNANAAFAGSIDNVSLVRIA